MAIAHLDIIVLLALLLPLRPALRARLAIIALVLKEQPLHVQLVTIVRKLRYLLQCFVPLVCIALRLDWSSLPVLAKLAITVRLDLIPVLKWLALLEIIAPWRDFCCQFHALCVA
jgi:hypothetical protein